MILKQLKHKLLSPEDLIQLRTKLNNEQKSIVFTNGCFDLIHLGHIDYLSKAKDLGNVLVVGVNSDESVRGLGKGILRPIKDELQRATILSAFEFVDYVVIFNDDTPIKLITALQPQILVKGGDYNPSETDLNSKSYIVGSKEVKQLGGEVKVIPFVEGYSTSAIEKKIRQGNM